MCVCAQGAGRVGYYSIRACTHTHVNLWVYTCLVPNPNIMGNYLSYLWIFLWVPITLCHPELLQWKILSYKNVNRYIREITP